MILFRTRSPISRLVLRGAATLLIALFAGVTVYAAEQLYTCGMHPQIIKKEAGNCPICGMKLTPIHGSAGKKSADKTAAPGERKIKYYKSTMTPGEVKPGPGKDSMGMDMVPVYEGEEAGTESSIQIDAGTRQRMNLRTGVVERGPVRREFRTVGTITYNEEGLREITTKYEGWIEKLFVSTTYAAVKKDSPLFEMYSPDLYNAELNYLVARRTEGDEGGPLSRAALARLQLFDVSREDIDEIKTSGQAKRTFVFRAPSDGVVIEKMAVAGQMMKPGERIYRLADLSSVWVQAQIYEKDLPFVRDGQEAVVRSTYGGDRQFEGRVALVLPQVQEETRSAVARIVLPNSDGFLKPGMFVDVLFSAELARDAVLVPDMAVLRSGERNTVFIANADGSFDVREVKLGARSSGNFYEVLSGLNAGDIVVTSGQFMLDSESQLREAIQKMLKSPDTASLQPSTAESHKHPTSPDEAAPKPASTAVTSQNSSFESLVQVAVDASEALGNDRVDSYHALAAKFDETLNRVFSEEPHAAHGPLGALKNAFTSEGTLEDARAQFAKISTVVVDTAHERNLHRKLGLRVFECSMAPGGSARWFQRSAQKRNPFFGSEMPGCGTELDASTSNVRAARSLHVAAGLPPGHPPISDATIVDYLRSQAAAQYPLHKSSDEACGSCGMTAAAMAAGEPCDHDGKDPQRSDMASHPGT